MRRHLTIAAVVLLAACGGGDDEATESTTTDARPTTTLRPATTTTNVIQDRADFMREFTPLAEEAVAAMGDMNGLQATPGGLDDATRRQLVSIGERMQNVFEGLQGIEAPEGLDAAFDHLVTATGEMARTLVDVSTCIPAECFGEFQGVVPLPQQYLDELTALVERIAPSG
jgi:hypothetical protein